MDIPLEIIVSRDNVLLTSFDQLMEAGPKDFNRYRWMEGPTTLYPVPEL